MGSEIVLNAIVVEQSVVDINQEDDPVHHVYPHVPRAPINYLSALIRSPATVSAANEGCTLKRACRHAKLRLAENLIRASTVSYLFWPFESKPRGTAQSIFMT